MEEEEIDDDDEDEDMDKDDPEQKKPGRPRKSWDESGIDSKKRKTDELLKTIRELATELGISFFDLIKFLGKREADIIGDRDVSELFKQMNR